MPDSNTAQGIQYIFYVMKTRDRASAFIQVCSDTAQINYFFHPGGADRFQILIPNLTDILPVTAYPPVWRDHRIDAISPFECPCQKIGILNRSYSRPRAQGLDFPAF